MSARVRRRILFSAIVVYAWCDNSTMTLTHYKSLLNAGLGDEDISALYRLKKAMFDKDRA